jgi:Uncharacterized conserved protein
VAFHARHKLQLLAHDPVRYRSAGRVVAVAGGGPRAEAAYRDLFLAAMASRASLGRTANALQHAYSRIGRQLDRPRRLDLVARIEASGAARSRSACRSRCSRTTRAAGISLAGGANLPQALSPGAAAAALRARLGGSGMKPLVRAT